MGTPGSGEGLQPLAEFGGGICGTEERGGDCDGGGSGSDYGGGGIESDAADRDEDGVWSGLFSETTDAFGADGRLGGLLGDGGKDGADGEVVGGCGEDAGQERFS